MSSFIYESAEGENRYFRGEPQKIGGATVLFVDDSMVENRLNLKRTQRRAAKSLGNPVLVADRPWEKGTAFYPTVIYDEEESLYKMWYWCFDRDAFYLGMNPEKGSCVYKMLYAESSDGLSWTKPNLKSVPFGPYSKSNIVFTGNGGCGSGRVFIDHTEQDPARRFKVIYNEKGKGAGPSLAVSRDGRSWAVDRHFSGTLKGDCHLHVLYDKTRAVWQLFGRPRVVSEMYPRDLAGADMLNAPKYHAMRRVALAESADLKTWTKAREILRPGDGHGFTEMDNMCSFSYGGKLMAFVSCFTDDPHSQSPQAMEAYLAFGDDAYNWHMLPNPEPILPKGRSGDFDESLVYISGYPTELSGGVAFYYTGYSVGEDPMVSQTAIGTAMFRKDGFAELSAGGEGGCLVTKEFILEGNRLELNCRSSGPKAFTLVEVVTFDGRSVRIAEGFSWEDCDPIRTNADSCAVTWKGQSSLESLKGERIYLRIYMQNAGIYSMTVKNGG